MLSAYGYVELVGEGEHGRLVIRRRGGRSSGRRRLADAGAEVVVVVVPVVRGGGGEEVVRAGAGAGEVEELVHAHGRVGGAHRLHPVEMVAAARVVAHRCSGAGAGGGVVRAHSHAELHAHGNFPLRRHPGKLAR